MVDLAASFCSPFLLEPMTLNCFQLFRRTSYFRAFLWSVESNLMSMLSGREIGPGARFAAPKRNPKAMLPLLRSHPQTNLPPMSYFLPLSPLSPVKIKENPLKFSNQSDPPCLTGTGNFTEILKHFRPMLLLLAPDQSPSCVPVTQHQWITSLTQNAFAMYFLTPL